MPQFTRCGPTLHSSNYRSPLTRRSSRGLINGLKTDPGVDDHVAHQRLELLRPRMHNTGEGDDSPDKDTGLVINACFSVVFTTSPNVTVDWEDGLAIVILVASGSRAVVRQHPIKDSQQSSPGQFVRSAGSGLAIHGRGVYETIQVSWNFPKAGRRCCGHVRFAELQ